MATVSAQQNFLSRGIAQFGGRVLGIFGNLHEFASYVRQTLVQAMRPPFRRGLIIQHMEFIGNQSLTIVTLSAFFVGAVFALQIGEVFKIFRAEGIMGAATGKALARELAPMMTSFLLAGRAGAAMTAEIATMRVNEQVDAMEAMAVEPVHYLVVPRLYAILLMAPILSGIFVFIGVLGAFFIGVFIFDVDQGAFFNKINDLVTVEDVWSGFQKAFIFGGLIALVACWYGLTARGGAKGVGRATTNSVVMTLLVLLICDFIMTYLQIRF